MAASAPSVSGLFLALVSLSLLAGAAIANPAGASEYDPPLEPHYLHLRGDHQGNGSYRNFTTQPPPDGPDAHLEPCRVTQQGQATWCWQMNRSPRAWTLQAGTPVEVVIHLSNLQRAPAGLIDPEAPAHVGDLRMDVVLTRGSSHEAARGTAYIPPPLQSGEDAVEIHMSLQVQEDVTWNTRPGDAPAVELLIHLSGMIRRDLPPTIATGPQADSRLHIPDFPLQAFHAWEQAEAEARACETLLLAQRTCTTVTDAPDDPAGIVQEAPLPGILLIVGLLAAYAQAQRRRDHHR